MAERAAPPVLGGGPFRTPLPVGGHGPASALADPFLVVIPGVDSWRPRGARSSADLEPSP
jgi:hypothetical protein